MSQDNSPYHRCLPEERIELGLDLIRLGADLVENPRVALLEVLRSTKVPEGHVATGKRLGDLEDDWISAALWHWEPSLFREILELHARFERPPVWRRFIFDCILGSEGASRRLAA